MKETAYRKSDSVVYRKIGEHVVLVPIRHDVADLESVFTLDEVSARIWSLIDGKATCGSIAQKLAGEFDVTREEAEEDVKRILEDFKEFQRNIKLTISNKIYGKIAFYHLTKMLKSFVSIRWAKKKFSIDDWTELFIWAFLYNVVGVKKNLYVAYQLLSKAR